MFYDKFFQINSPLFAFSIKILAKELKSGLLPPFCNIKTPTIDQDVAGSIINPQNKSELYFKNHICIAKYHKEINCWVLEKGFSPIDIPLIGRRHTISLQQYNILYIYAKYKLFVSPNYHAIINKPNFSYFTILATKMDEDGLEQEIKEQYSKIPNNIIEILEKEDKHPTKSYILTYTKSKYNNPKHTEIIVSTEDILHCCFNNIPYIDKLNISI